MGRRTVAAADAIVGSLVVVVAVVGLRARDLQDWLVQVVHFALSWDDDDDDVVVVVLIVDEQILVWMMMMILKRWKYNTRRWQIYTYERS